MGLANYLLTVRKLNNMGRWATEYMHMRSTVSEHSFFVAQTGQMLAVIEEQHGAVVDWKRLFTKLLNHDVVESMTGDILSTTKHKNPEIRDMVSRIEEELVEENIIRFMDAPYDGIFREILHEGKDDSLEGQILKYADIIDALFECMHEVALHNTKTFQEKFDVLRQQLEQSPLISVQMFLNDIMPQLLADVNK